VKDPQRKQATDARCLESLCKLYQGINQALAKLEASIIFITNFLSSKTNSCHNKDAFSKQKIGSYKVLKSLCSCWIH